MELSIRWKISWRLYHGQRRRLSRIPFFRCNQRYRSQDGRYYFPEVWASDTGNHGKRPAETLKIRGISEKKLAAIVESYGKNQVFRELMTFLAPFKVTPKKVNMILKKFGNESVDIIRHRPYMLSAVKGFGFLTVDAIGRQCCCALNDHPGYPGASDIS